MYLRCVFAEEASVDEAASLADRLEVRVTSATHEQRSRRAAAGSVLRVSHTSHVLRKVLQLTAYMYCLPVPLVLVL